MTSTAALLLALLLLGLAAFFGEDAAILLGSVRLGGVGGGDVIATQLEDGLHPTSHAVDAPGDYIEEESMRWKAVIRAAEESNFACTNSSLPTSIHATIKAGDVTISLPNESRWPFVSVNLTFRAYDSDWRPQRYGGDVFIVDYQSHWASKHNSPAYEVVKASAFAVDRVDGTHSARLHFPRTALEAPNVAVSLRHYYTCHDGLKLPRQLSGGKYHKLDFGPHPWEKAARKIRSALLQHTGTEMENSTLAKDILPKCSEDPNGEYILRGAWTEQLPKPPEGIVKMSLGAKWTPFYCTMDEDTTKISDHLRGTSFRIGDSTMPGTQVDVGQFSPLLDDPGGPRKGIKIKIGISYTPYVNDANKHQHVLFTDVLQNFRAGYNESSFDNTPDDTFVFGNGLHHIFHGNFSAPATVSLVVRSFCQLGLVFPGHMLLRSLNPIQQHRHPAVDQTSLNVRRINWELQSRLHESRQRLVDLCLSIPSRDLGSFVAISDRDGNILPDEEAKALMLQLHNYSWDRDNAMDHKLLAHWMQNMSVQERKRRYSSRKVTWIDFEGFLLPRPGHYRKGDKIHDGKLFFGPEWNMLSIIESYSSKG